MRGSLVIIKFPMLTEMNFVASNLIKQIRSEVEYLLTLVFSTSRRMARPPPPWFAVFGLLNGSWVNACRYRPPMCRQSNRIFEALRPYRNNWQSIDRLLN